MRLITMALILALLGTLVGTVLRDLVDEPIYYAFIKQLPCERIKDVIVVDVDQRAIQSAGRWPWAPEQLMMLVRNIEQYGARAIGLAIYLADAKAISNNAFGSMLMSSKVVVSVDENGNYFPGRAVGGGAKIGVLDSFGDEALIRSVYCDASSRPFSFVLANFVSTPSCAAISEINYRNFSIDKVSAADVGLWGSQKFAGKIVVVDASFGLFRRDTPVGKYTPGEVQTIVTNAYINNSFVVGSWYLTAFACFLVTVAVLSRNALIFVVPVVVVVFFALHWFTVSLSLSGMLTSAFFGNWVRVRKSVKRTA